MTTVRPLVEASQYFPDPGALPSFDRQSLSALANGLVGSEILKIAAEIRALQRAGKSICNLTVGDFSSKEFPVPAELEAAIARALAGGQTNYPPSDGVLDLRKEVMRFYERELGLSYPLESVLIAGGARPVIYATYKAILDPGEKVLYQVPSWNNNHYSFLTGGRGVELAVGPETNFLPTAENLRPLLPDVRLICINSPLNPTGTVFSREQVRGIAGLLVEENRRRKIAGERPLYAMWDQVYWMLTFGEAGHHTPPELVPESAAWTILVDGISKAFAATGLRVGWAVGPPNVVSRMRDILGHVGAWAPRPEQVATAQFLANAGAIASYHERMIRGLRRRLDLLYEGFEEMARAGLPVHSFTPQGAIYLTVRFDLTGRRANGSTIRTNEEIRQLLLGEAGFAVVPFQAFGLQEETGWMRLSVGAISPSEIESGLARVRSFLERVR